MNPCHPSCKNNELTLCRHRFNFNADILYCNNKKFRYYDSKLKRFKGWQDARILNYFLNYVRGKLDTRLVSKSIIAVIITKDKDFIEDAKIEWRLHGNPNENPVFGKNIVRFGQLSIFIQTVDCRQYGDTGNDNLRCAIYKTNRLFSKMKDRNSL